MLLLDDSQLEDLDVMARALAQRNGRCSSPASELRITHSGGAKRLRDGPPEETSRSEPNSHSVNAWKSVVRRADSAQHSLEAGISAQGIEGRIDAQPVRLNVAGSSTIEPVESPV